MANIVSGHGSDRSTLEARRGSRIHVGGANDNSEESAHGGQGIRRRDREVESSRSDQREQR